MPNSVASLFHFAASCGTQSGILPGIYDNLCPDGKNPSLTTVSDILVIVGNVVRILIALSGGIAILVILISAVFYITSAGDPGRVKKAKDTLVSTVIGLVLIIAAYAIVTFIAGGLSS